MSKPSRRAFLTTAGGGIALLAGCVDTLSLDSSDAREAAEEGVDDEDDGDGPALTETPDDVDIPLVEPEVPLGYELGELEADAVSGGVPQDGIPSIDDPVYDDLDYGDEAMDPDDPVFGIELEGVAKAYPQNILVYHEIVNDVIEGTGVAVTYCPLTGTAIGFERGSVEFGVSGMLVNSNLIMYDRETESWWPQIHATSPLGKLEGWSLSEFRVTWTTWGRWRDAYPETEILTEETGHVRNYDADPYGGYNPDSGYYVNSDIMFLPRNENDDYEPKEVFVGARSADGAVAFRKDRLRENRLLETTVGGTPYLAAYHDLLDSAWVYRNPDGDSIEIVDGGYVDENGESHEADELPMESVNAFDAFWFAWYGFYPETEVVS